MSSRYVTVDSLWLSGNAVGTPIPMPTPSTTVISQQTHAPLKISHSRYRHLVCRLSASSSGNLPRGQNKQRARSVSLPPQSTSKRASNVSPPLEMRRIISHLFKTRKTFAHMSKQVCFHQLSTKTGSAVPMCHIRMLEQ